MFSSGSLGVLQMEQVELGRKNGLSEKEIAMYAKSRYNFLQMQELRLALEAKKDPYQTKALFDSRLSHERMGEMRVRLENGEILRKERNLPAAGILSGLLFLLLSGGALLYMYFSDVPYLVLKEDTVQVGKGEHPDAASYVESFAGDLFIPEFDTKTAGRKAAVYILSKNDIQLPKVLWIEVE